MNDINFDELPGFIIAKIHHSMINFHNKSLESYNLTSSQMKVMAYLWRNEGKIINQKEIHEFLDIKPSSLSKLINILVQKGFINKSDNLQDTRYKLITLTDKGKNLKNVSRQAMLDIEKKMLDGFSDDDVNNLKKLLNKLKNNVDNLV